MSKTLREELVRKAKLNIPYTKAEKESIAAFKRELNNAPTDPVFGSLLTDLIHKMHHSHTMKGNFF